ncbi:MAG: PLP-dependent aminotransferase family protein [Pseudomonadota bacterium]
MAKSVPADPVLPLAFDRSLPEPLHRQLYDQLCALILAGRLSPGVRLPSTRALAADHGVSRNTVVSAYDQLLAEGYVTGTVGSGTYVSTILPDELLSARATEPAGQAATPGEPSARGARLLAMAPGRDRRHQAFLAGVPDLEHFPFDQWARLLSLAWRRPDRTLLVGGDAGGYAPLRRAIAGYLWTARAVRCAPEQVIIVAGVQQGIRLTADALLDHGDQVWIEDPSYPGVRGALAGAGAATIAVTIDDQGIDVAAGERLAPGARLVCVTPSHHYPLGTTMSLGRRLELLDWAERNDAWILEDDYDSEFRYAGRPLASLQGLDRAGRVIYAGSFSKVMFPSLRLGYLVVPPGLVEVVRRVRAAVDDHPPSIAQPALARFIDDGLFAAHVRRMRRLYAARQECLLAAAKRQWSGLLEVQPDDAGMHLVAWLSNPVRRRMSDREAAALAFEHNVTTQPLSGFASRADLRHGLALGYAAIPEDEIEAGAARLAEALSG